MRSGWWGHIRIAVASALLAAVLIVPAGAQGPVTINFWHGMSGVLQPAVNELTASFNKLNPGIVVNAQYQGTYGVLNQKLIASVAAGNPPVITQVFPNWTDQLIQAKAIVPIEKFVKGPGGLSKAELDDFFPVLLRANTFKGVMWTLPFNKSVYLLFYNADLLRSRNLKVPETWDDLVQVARALTVEEGGRTVRYGFVVRPTTDQFAVMFLGNGGRYMKTYGRVVDFNSPAGVEALQFLVDLVQKHKVAYVLPGFADADFGAGRTAMHIATSPGIAFSKAAVAGRFVMGVAPLPYKKVKTTLLSGTDVAITSKATPEQQEAAWKYIKYLTSTLGTARWALQTDYLPVRRSASKTLQSVYQKQNPLLLPNLESLALAQTEPGIMEWQEIRNIIQDAVEQAILGKLTPQQALDEAAAKANRLLSERK